MIHLSSPVLVRGGTRLSQGLQWSWEWDRNEQFLQTQGVCTSVRVLPGWTGEWWVKVRKLFANEKTTMWLNFWKVPWDPAPWMSAVTLQYQQSEAVLLIPMLCFHCWLSLQSLFFVICLWGLWTSHSAFACAFESRTPPSLLPVGQANHLRPSLFIATFRDWVSYSMPTAPCPITFNEINLRPFIEALMPKLQHLGHLMKSWFIEKILILGNWG